MYMIQEYKSPVKTYLESVQEKGIFSFLAFAVQKSPQKEAGTDEAWASPCLHQAYLLEKV